MLLPVSLFVSAFISKSSMHKLASFSSSGLGWGGGGRLYIVFSVQLLIIVKTYILISPVWLGMILNLLESFLQRNKYCVCVVKTGSTTHLRSCCMGGNKMLTVDIKIHLLYISIPSVDPFLMFKSSSTTCVFEEVPRFLHQCIGVEELSNRWPLRMHLLHSLHCGQ